MSVNKTTRPGDDADLPRGACFDEVEANARALPDLEANAVPTSRQDERERKHAAVDPVDDDPETRRPMKLDHSLARAHAKRWIDTGPQRAGERAEPRLPRQIIRELESSLQPLGSPIILNGSGYGFFANHSLVMASYISRANAAVIDLRSLLSQG